MTPFKIYILAAVIPTTVFSQKINAQDPRLIRTDRDCIEFINKNIKGFERFYFDTIFTQDEIVKYKIKDSYRNWGLIDFNSDHKMDLYFAGKFPPPSFGNFAKYLYLSNNKGGYDLHYLSREEPGYSPLIFSRTIGGKKLLFIYEISGIDGLKTDSIIAAKADRYPKGIKAIDTLVYKYKNVINYTSRPSRISFDSIQYRSNHGYGYTIYKSGQLVFFETRFGNRYKEKLSIPDSSVSLLKNLISEIDLKNTNPNFYKCSCTDQSAVTLTIFQSGNAIKLSDYGMKSTFTLMAIYRLIGSFYPVKI